MITSAEEFVRLRTSDKPDDYLRAANEAAVASVWSELIENFPAMRFWVAHNKRVPIEILSVLATDGDARVRSAVAMKNKLSDDLFSLLASDADASVRERIVYNKNVPPEILKRLVTDPCERISQHAKKRLLGIG